MEDAEASPQQRIAAPEAAAGLKLRPLAGNRPSAQIGLLEREAGCLRCAADLRNTSKQKEPGSAETSGLLRYQKTRGKTNHYLTPPCAT